MFAIIYPMNWFDEAKIVFNEIKPAHFTNFNHCEECAEHDRPDAARRRCGSHRLERAAQPRLGPDLFLLSGWQEILYARLNTAQPRYDWIGFLFRSIPFSP